MGFLLCVSEVEQIQREFGVRPGTLRYTGALVPWEGGGRTGGCYWDGELESSFCSFCCSGVLEGRRDGYACRRACTLTRAVTPGCQDPPLE